MAWSCDGNRLASGSFDKTVTIWNLESDRLVSIQNYPWLVTKAYNCMLSYRGERVTTRCIQAVLISCAGTPLNQKSWSLHQGTRQSGYGMSEVRNKAKPE